MGEIKTEETTVAISVNSNYLNRGWITMYGLLMRQADNGEHVKADVIKACKRVLEDLQPTHTKLPQSGKEKK